MIETNSPQLQEVWDSFLKEWPLTRLRQMKLREYTAAGQDRTFTAWIERRLDKMGSIWGGSSFKFGIFSRRDKTPKPAGDAASYTEDYAWYTKYGANPEDAFAKVRSIVSQVAEAAARGDYASIDAADLGESYKWKIAFQYQDKNNPAVIAVFKPAWLRAWLKGRVGTIPQQTSELHSVVNELRCAMAGITDAVPVPELIKRLRTDRTNQHMRPLLALAKLILGNCNPDLGRSAHGDRNVYAVVWDMNVLFEEYVGQLATRVLSEKGFAVDLQEGGSLYLAQDVDGRQNAFPLKPDILVRHDRKPWVVIDTKWKILDPQSRSLGVSEADVYQVLAYAHRYEIDLAILVFPHRGALGAAGVKKEFLVFGGRGNAVRVYVSTLDVARLESAAEQLEHVLLPEWPKARVG